MTEPLVKVKQLTKIFHKKTAVNDISFNIYEGETLGLVGESGCGKSTLGKLLLRLEKATSGEVHFHGKEVLSLSSHEFKPYRKEMQIIFQDPYSSLNPRMTVGDIIKEPLIIHGLSTGRLEELLALVGLDATYSGRFPHELSGGQRQRVGIARALAVNPRFLVCDEPLSALDVSVQAQIVNLLKKLQSEFDLTYLFIAHDLSMVKYISHRVAVVYLGSLMEIGPTDQLYSAPKHPYTQALLSSIFIPDPTIEKNRKKTLLQGEIPNPLQPIKGCPFASRCPHATKTCHQIAPPLKEVAPTQFVSCHL
jgi:oligopeptide transport system ATP-binding protein